MTSPVITKVEEIGLKLSSIFTWTVKDGGGDDVGLTRGRLRRERRRSRDVTALPMAALFVTVPVVCSELKSLVIP